MSGFAGLKNFPEHSFALKQKALPQEMAPGKEPIIGPRILGLSPRGPWRSRFLFKKEKPGWRPEPQTNPIKFNLISPNYNVR
jgi:hypothetical protein